MKPGDLCVSVNGENVLKITVAFGYDLCTTINAALANRSGMSWNEGVSSKNSKILTFFEKFQAKAGDAIYPTAHIAIKFIVKTDFDGVLLGWEGTNEIVHLLH